MVERIVTGRGMVQSQKVVRRAIRVGLALCFVHIATAAYAGQLPVRVSPSLEHREDKLPSWSRVDWTKLDIFERSTSADLRDEIACLAQNIYFEALNEPDEGKIAVAHVVMNRVSASRFPETVCDVVRQGGEIRRHRCQFSWWCDGRSDKPLSRSGWEHSVELALNVYWGQTLDPTHGALWYHADYVDPYWRGDFIQGRQIGRHIFYLQRPEATLVANRKINQVVKD